MTRSVRLGSIEQFPDGKGVPVSVGNRRYAVFRIGSELFAIDDACTHRGFPLNDGILTESTLRCRTHGACFDLHSGAVVRGPASRPLRTYPIQIVDGEVELTLDQSN